VFYRQADLIERTRQSCADDVINSKLRDQLLAIELAAHRSGWNSPDADPALFQLNMDPDTGETDWHLTEQYNDMLRTLVGRAQGNTGRALQFMARHAESVTRFLRTGLPPERWADKVPDELLGELTRLREQSWPQLGDAGMAGEDLIEPEFIGYGLRAEVWAASVPLDGPEREKAERYAGQGRLHEYQARQEYRYVWFITRTGETWIVERRRSHTPIILMVHPTDDGDQMGLGGGVLNALGRLVNAVVTEDVPVWQSTEMTQPPERSRPNPLIRPNR
jgi:hypothetical protein